MLKHVCLPELNSRFIADCRPTCYCLCKRSPDSLMYLLYCKVNLAFSSGCARFLCWGPQSPLPVCGIDACDKTHGLWITPGKNCAVESDSRDMSRFVFFFTCLEISFDPFCRAVSFSTVFKLFSWGKDKHFYTAISWAIMTDPNCWVTLLQ